MFTLDSQWVASPLGLDIPCNKRAGLCLDMLDNRSTTRVSTLCNDRTFQINAGLGADVFYATFPFIAQIVKAKTVHFGVNDF